MAKKKHQSPDGINKLKIAVSVDTTIRSTGPYISFFESPAPIPVWSLHVVIVLDTVENKIADQFLAHRPSPNAADVMVYDLATMKRTRSVPIESLCGLAVEVDVRSDYDALAPFCEVDLVHHLSRVSESINQSLGAIQAGDNGEYNDEAGPLVEVDSDPVVEEDEEFEPNESEEDNIPDSAVDDQDDWSPELEEAFEEEASEPYYPEEYPGDNPELAESYDSEEQDDDEIMFEDDEASEEIQHLDSDDEIVVDEIEIVEEYEPEPEPEPVAKPARAKAVEKPAAKPAARPAAKPESIPAKPQPKPAPAAAAAKPEHPLATKLKGLNPGGLLSIAKQTGIPELKAKAILKNHGADRLRAVIIDVASKNGTK